MNIIAILFFGWLGDLWDKLRNPTSTVKKVNIQTIAEVGLHRVFYGGEKLNITQIENMPAEMLAAGLIRITNDILSTSAPHFLTFTVALDEEGDNDEYELIILRPNQFISYYDLVKALEKMS